MTNHSPITQLPSDRDELKLQVTFPHHTSSQLFAAFTEPDLLLQWWPPVAKVDLRSGGRYELTWPAMNWALSGRYTTFEPGQRLGFTWQWAHEPDLPERQVDVVFEPLEQGTQLTLTHGTYDDSKRDAADRQSHLDGWNHFLQQLYALPG